MSKAKMVTNPNRISSIPGAIGSCRSRADSIASSNNPEILLYASLFGNRKTKRLARRNCKRRKLNFKNLIGINL